MAGRDDNETRGQSGSEGPADAEGSANPTAPRRGPGAPKNTAGTRAPRAEAPISPQSVDHFLERTRLVERLDFATGAVSYSRLDQAERDASTHAGNPAFLAVLAAVKSETGALFAADVRDWAARFLRCFPEDASAVAWCVRLPDNVLQAVFIAYAWNRQHLRGGATQAVVVFKTRNLKRLKKKLNEWREKLVAGGHPAAADLIALPFAGSLLLLGSDAKATGVATARRLASAFAVCVAAALGAFSWARCDRDDGSGATTDTAGYDADARSAASLASTLDRRDDAATPRAEPEQRPPIVFDSGLAPPQRATRREALDASLDNSEQRREPNDVAAQGAVHRRSSWSRLNGKTLTFRAQGQPSQLHSQRGMGFVLLQDGTVRLAENGDGFDLLGCVGITSGADIAIRCRRAHPEDGDALLIGVFEESGCSLAGQAWYVLPDGETQLAPGQSWVMLDEGSAETLPAFKLHPTAECGCTVGQVPGTYVPDPIAALRRICGGSRTPSSVCADRQFPENENVQLACVPSP